MIKNTYAVYAYDTLDESLMTLTLTDKEHSKMLANGWILKPLPCTKDVQTESSEQGEAE
jgi:hypothetical protein